MKGKLCVAFKRIISFLLFCYGVAMLVRVSKLNIKKAKNSSDTNSFLIWKSQKVHKHMMDSRQKQSKYRFNCQNINTIEIIKRDVGGGRSKAVDIGLVDGEKVVIKRLSFRKKPDISTDFRQLLFLKEIMLLDQLDHPALIKMMGFCVTHLQSEEYKTYPKSSGILAVYEYGENFNVTLLELNSTQRLKHALNLADLIRYMQYSPAGPLLIGDFKARSHFLMVNGTIKLIDLDFVHGIEFPCKLETDEKEPICIFNYTCKKRNNNFIDAAYCNDPNQCNIGVCSGVNARLNTGYIYEAFFKHLLNPKHFAADIKDDVTLFLNNVKSHNLDSDSMVHILQILAAKIK